MSETEIAQPPLEITRLLRDWSGGDGAALERLLPLVYDQLRDLARSQLRHERPDHTLQPTALVHEAYLRLSAQREAAGANRSQFFSLAARLMRRVLVDHARARLAAKRGGPAPRLSIEGLDIELHSEPVDLLDLDRALDRLTAAFERPGRIVEMRFFAGLEVEEIAALLGVSDRTVKRDWSFARAWLLRELGTGA
jgi:RNA polymerase sigma factor (TIGR02999 family)